MDKPIRKSFFVLLWVVMLALLPVSCAGPGGKPDTNVLPVLQSLKLSGKLIYIQYQPDGNQVVQLDLSNGTRRVLFPAPANSWLASAEASPPGALGGSQILLAYSPPPPPGQMQFSFTDLDLIPSTGAGSPTPLLIRFNPNESYYMPAWSPDGQWVYYSHNQASSSNPAGFDAHIERIKPGGGSEPQVILADAMWPRLSPDGAKMVYTSLKPEDANNALMVANADGSSPQPVIQTSQPVIVDAHLFSPDGQYVYFSMVAPPQQSLAQPPARPAGIWADLAGLFGAQPVYAHNLPSDLFRAPVSGGPPERLTNLQGSSLYAAFSPDGQWLALISQAGIYIMKPDGSHLNQISNVTALGSVNWVR